MPDEPLVVLRWGGDESVYLDGVPNRDVTTEDNLAPEDLDRAVEHGTHERVD